MRWPMDIYIYTRESGEMGITWYNSSDVCIGMELWKNRSGQGGPNHTRCSLWSFGSIFGSRAHETYFSFWFLSCRETMMILLQKRGRTIWKLIWIEWDTRTEIGSPNMVPILWEILSTTDRFCQVCHHLKNQLGKPWFGSWTLFPFCLMESDIPVPQNFVSGMEDDLPKKRNPDHLKRNQRSSMGHGFLRKYQWLTRKWTSQSSKYTFIPGPTQSTHQILDMVMCWSIFWF